MAFLGIKFKPLKFLGNAVKTIAKVGVGVALTAGAGVAIKGVSGALGKLIHVKVPAASHPTTPTPGSSFGVQGPGMVDTPALRPGDAAPTSEAPSSSGGLGKWLLIGAAVVAGLFVLRKSS